MGRGKVAITDRHGPIFPGGRAFSEGIRSGTQSRRRAFTFPRAMGCQDFVAPTIAFSCPPTVF